MSDDFDDLFEDDDDSEPTGEVLATADHDVSAGSGALTLDPASLELSLKSEYGGSHELRVRAEIKNHTGKALTLGTVQLVLRGANGELRDSATDWKDVKFVDRQELMQEITLERGALAKLGRMEIWAEWESTLKCTVASATGEAPAMRKGDGDAYEEPWPVTLNPSEDAKPWLPRFEVAGLSGFVTHEYDDFRSRWLAEISEASGSLRHDRTLVLALRDEKGKVLTKEQEDVELHETNRIVKFDFYGVKHSTLKRARSVDLVAKVHMQRRERLCAFSVARRSS